MQDPATDARARGQVLPEALIRRAAIALPKRSLPDVPLPQPAGPLRSFAQVPTELMEELTRLRSAERPVGTAGIPGRRDPTPLPAPAEAIAPRAPWPGAAVSRPDAAPRAAER